MFIIKSFIKTSKFCISLDLSISPFTIRKIV